MISIYLAGNIRKEHEKTSELFWEEEHLAFLEKTLNQDVVFLNPATRTDDLSDQLSVFGRDMVQVTSADFILVDARERRGLGVGAEMMWAKMRKTPLLTWAPQDTHYRKKEGKLLGVTVQNWVHPFIESLSDLLFDDLDQVAQWINTHMETPFSIKGPEIVTQAMQYYMSNQFASDTPMQEINKSFSIPGKLNIT